MTHAGENEAGKRPVILFDGFCRFCNASVRFVLRRDPAGVFRFAPLQSPAGRRLLRRHGLDPGLRESTVLIDADGAHFRSEAALRTARRLRAPWPALAALRVVPRPIRDTVYNWIGRNRYRWFGLYRSCPLPDERWQQRFLPDSGPDGPPDDDPGKY